MRLLFHFLFLLTIFTSTRCSKILGVFPSPGYSQFILCEKLMTALARRGHEVTVISAFKPNEEVKNYRSIVVDGLVEKTGENLFLQDENTLLHNLVSFYNLGNFLTEYILSHQKVQKLIHSNETFDLVIVEQFINEAHMGFSQHFNAPLIIFSSIGLSEWNSHLVGNVRLPSVEPLSFSAFTNRMTFFQRLTNSVLNTFDTLYNYFVVFPRQQALLSEYFPNQMDLNQVMFNTSLMLLNSHPSSTQPTTLTSAIVEVGGFHIESKQLPQEIQKFLDGAKEGAVFFSMGSNLKMSDLSNHTLSALLRTFSKLKQRVLWKFDGSSILNKPGNLLVSKWLPQVDILAHPNIKAFITHGGLLSTTEAIHHGVPMVGMPVFGDQKMNVARSVEKGITIYLPFKELSEESLYKAIQEILGNPKYKQNANKYSKILRDRIVHPLDEAIYWVEYVLKYGGATHLRNSSLDLHWFQLYLIDVIGFILLISVILYFSVKLLFTRMFKALKNDTKEKQKLIRNKKIN